MVVGAALYCGYFLECVYRKFHGGGIFAGGIVPDCCRYYSTVKDAYFMDENQMSFELDVVESSVVEEQTTIKVDGVSFDVKLEGVGDSETVFAGLFTADGKLSAIRQYPAAESISVDFAPGETGKFVKIMLWADKIKPSCDACTITLP